MRDIARDIAFMLDQDGVTTRDMQPVLENMESRIKSGEENGTLVDNYYDLKEAERELDYWEGTARQHEQEKEVPVAPAPITRIFVYDDNRKGISREQKLDIITETSIGVIEADLSREGFEKVIAVPDASTRTGLSWIWFKPSAERYVRVEEKNHEINAILKALAGGEDYRKENTK